MGLFEAGAEEGAAAKRHVEGGGEVEGKEEEGEGKEEEDDIFRLTNEKEVFELFNDGDIENW